MNKKDVWVKLKRFMLKVIFCPQKIFWAGNEFFFKGRPTNTKNNMVAFNKNHVIKVENFKHRHKKNGLAEEADILKYLTKCGNICNPKFVKEGVHISGRPYFIMERVFKKGKANLADILCAFLEQHKVGICHRDINDENVIFDGTIAKLIDYDQAEFKEELKKLLPLESIEYYAKNYVYINWVENCNPLYLLKDNHFDFEQTSLYKNLTKNGMELPYYYIDQAGIYSRGKFDINNIKHILDKVDFKDKEKVLDFGCNMGSLSFYLKNRNCDVYSFDSEENALIATKLLSNILNLRCTVAKIDLIEEHFLQKYDTVFLLNDEFLNKFEMKEIEPILAQADRLVIKVAKKDYKQSFKNFSVTNTYQLENEDFYIAILE